MKTSHITAVLLVGLIVVVASPALRAGQRPRNPGDAGGSSGGSSSGGGTSTGTAVPRDGGSTPWGGGSVSSRPSEPSSSSSGGRRPARASGGGDGSDTSTASPNSRARNGAPVTGYGVPRGSVATLPPIVSGPIYWGPNDWYFYPWGFGALGLGYFWDPWMWSGLSGGWGGSPFMDSSWGGAGGGLGAWDGSAGFGNASRDVSSNPLDQNLPTGGLRLKVTPRDAEVFVDGYYAGRVDDFDGARQQLKIIRGPHRVELRAAGYETVTFDVTVLPGESTTYKTDLKRR